MRYKYEKECLLLPGLAVARVWPHHAVAFTQYCRYQYCMLNGKAGGAGESHRMRNIDCKIQRGRGAIQEVLNAKNSIDQCIIPE